MLCASLPEETAASCIVQDTAFCTEMSQRLVEAYLKLPSFINPADLENVEAKWGLILFILFLYWITSSLRVHGLTMKLNITYTDIIGMHC